MGTHVHPWLIHVNVWQNPYSIVKQNKVKIKILKKDLSKILRSKYIKKIIISRVSLSCVVPAKSEVLFTLSALLLSVGSTQSLPQLILTNTDSAFTIGVQSRRRQAFLCMYIFFLFLFNFYFYFILLYNTVLVLPYIDMNPPQVYMSSQS